MVRNILIELLESLETAFNEADVRELVRKVVSHVLNKANAREILQSILKTLPLDVAGKQKSAIETAAEAIFAIEQTEAELETKELLEDVVDEVLLEKGEPHEVLARLVARLVEMLPMDFIKKGESIDYIATKARESILSLTDRKKLTETVDSITSSQREEIVIVLNEIFEKVYGEGIDYLYIIYNQ